MMHIRLKIREGDSMKVKKEKRTKIYEVNCYERVGGGVPCTIATFILSGKASDIVLEHVTLKVPCGKAILPTHLNLGMIRFIPGRRCLLISI